MQCAYFDRHECRSCTFMGVPYPRQVQDADAGIADLLAAHVAPDQWQPSIIGPESGFRNKAKLVVGGRRGEPTLGILDAAQSGQDLTGCGLYEPGLSRALPLLRNAIGDAELTPYDVRTRNGELKNLLVTHSPGGELMVRFVVRSLGQLGKIERLTATLQSDLPQVRVVTVNLLPDHRAALEGEQEITLTAQETLPMQINNLTLHLRPASFFQTNTVVAEQLYARARNWVADTKPGVVLDLYCGVGGFGLHAAGPTVRRVVGVERSAEAVASARRSARDIEVDFPTTQFDFIAGDAGAEAGTTSDADIVIVNPPRRGIGTALCAQLNSSAAEHLIYSSCNPQTLAADLDRLPDFGVQRAQVFHMFPQTAHHEVLVQLGRR